MEFWGNNTDSDDNTASGNNSYWDDNSAWGNNTDSDDNTASGNNSYIIEKFLTLVFALWLIKLYLYYFC